MQCVEKYCSAQERFLGGHMVALLTTANHKQKLAGNGAVQALLNPMVGLNPRKFKARQDTYFPTSGG